MQLIKKEVARIIACKNIVQVLYKISKTKMNNIRNNHFHVTGLLLFVLLLLIIFSTCSSEQKIELINGIRSGLSPEEIKTFTHLNQYQWEVIEDTKLSDDDPRPSYHAYKVEIKGYIDMGIEGDLKLEFYNNQLMATVFYPSSLSDYLNRLKYVRNIDIKKDQKIVKNGCEIFHSKNYEEQYYVRWTDIGILKKMDAWIRRYS